MKLCPPILVVMLGFVVSSCSSLPRPEVASLMESDAKALQLLRESSQKSGNAYQRFRSVEVEYDGEWGKLATKIQPVLTDPQFRKVSTDTYSPRLGKVVQIHRGAGGEKTVVRTRKNVEVTRNGERVSDEEERHAAALVADCYIVFTFGSSALLELGSGWKLIGERRLNRERCSLIAGTLRPGFGMSEGDGVIAWVGQETKYLKRVQMSLFGLASTAGADVDLTYGYFQPGPDGTVWPRYFNERIRRPFDIQAHEWRMTKLELKR